jgi:hypothetical protein
VRRLDQDFSWSLNSGSHSSWAGSLPHEPCPQTFVALVIFQMVSQFGLRPAWDHDPPTSTARVSGIMGMPHNDQLDLLRYGLTNVLPGLALD